MVRLHLKALLKMPNVATKPRAVDDVFEHQFTHQSSSIAFKLPLMAPPAISNMKVAIDTSSPYATSSPRFSQQVHNIHLNCKIDHENAIFFLSFAVVTPL